MLMHSGERRQPEVLADLGQRGCVAVFADIVVQVVDQLLLSLGQRRHRLLPLANSDGLDDGENPAKMQARKLPRCGSGFPVSMQRIISRRLVPWRNSESNLKTA